MAVCIAEKNEGKVVRTSRVTKKKKKTKREM